MRGSSEEPWTPTLSPVSLRAGVSRYLTGPCGNTFPKPSNYLMRIAFFWVGIDIADVRIVNKEMRRLPAAPSGCPRAGCRGGASLAAASTLDQGPSAPHEYSRAR